MSDKSVVPAEHLVAKLNAAVTRYQVPAVLRR
jgi:hypothetical protein